MSNFPPRKQTVLTGAEFITGGQHLASGASRVHPDCLGESNKWVVKYAGVRAADRHHTERSRAPRRSEITPGRIDVGAMCFGFVPPHHVIIMFCIAARTQSPPCHIQLLIMRICESSLASRDAEFIQIASVHVWLLIAQFHFAATRISSLRQFLWLKRQTQNLIN
jgi:hypothetical protein